MAVVRLINSSESVILSMTRDEAEHILETIDAARFATNALLSSMRRTMDSKGSPFARARVQSASVTETLRDALDR